MKFLVFDSKMDDQTSDANGEFELKGTETEISSIDPRVNIYHDCEDGWTVSCPLFGEDKREIPALPAATDHPRARFVHRPRDDSP